MKFYLKLALLIFASLFFACEEKPENKDDNQIDHVIKKLNNPLKMRRLDSLRKASMSSFQNRTINFIEYYEKALQIDSSDILNRINHAYSIWGFKHDTLGAVKELKSTLRMYPNSPDVLFAIGTLFYSVNLDSAFYYCEKAVSINPDNYINLYNLSQYYEEQGMYSKALLTIEKAIKIAPRNQSLIFLRGTYKTKNGDPLGGLKDMEIIPKNNLNDDAVYFNKALSLYMLKRYKECLVECEKAFNLGADDSNSYLIRGSAYIQLKQIEKGYPDIKKSYEMGNSEAAEIYIKLQDYYKTHKKV